MSESAIGLVLRTYPLTETSLVVHWLTPAWGRIATVAKGARRPRSPFHGKIDLFYLAEFSFHRSRRSELHTLREIGVRQTHPVLRRELGCLRQVSYCAALVNQATETETPLPEVFGLFKELLASMALAPPRPLAVFSFEFKLLAELGLEPDLETSRLSPAGRKLARLLREEAWPAVMALAVRPEPALEIQRFLHGFIIYHLGRIPKGRDSAVSV